MVSGGHFLLANGDESGDIGATCVIISNVKCTNGNGTSNEKSRGDGAQLQLSFDVKNAKRHPLLLICVVRLISLSQSCLISGKALLHCLEKDRHRFNSLALIFITDKSLGHILGTDTHGQRSIAKGQAVIDTWSQRVTLS